MTAPDYSDLPAIKILQGPTPSQIESGANFLGPMSNRSASWSAASEATPFFDQQAYVFLRTRHDSAERASARQRALFGRIYNALTGKTPYYSRLPGSILLSFFKLSEQPAPQWIISGGEYLLRLDMSERFVALVKQSKTVAAQGSRKAAND